MMSGRLPGNKESAGLMARFPHVRYAPWAVLAITLALTFHLWQSFEREAVRARQARFDYRARDISDRIEQRMLNYEQVLYGTRAFLVGRHELEHREFHVYMEAQRLEERLPGFQGISFAQVVPEAQKNAHEHAVRKDGVPDYAIHPSGKRQIYAPVSYIEPSNARNHLVLGFDNFSSPERKATIEKARDLDRAVISDRLELVQEAGESNKAGFLMFLPVYENGAAHGTEDERRAHIKGWLAASFRMSKLMQGVLGNDMNDLDVEIHDGSEISEPHLLFDSDDRASHAWTPLFQTSRQIEIGGRQWQLAVRSLPAFEARMDRSKASFTAIAGGLMSVLLAALAALLVRDRDRAVQMAESAGNEMRERARLQDALRENEERWKLALEGAGHGVWDYDVRTGKVNCSDLYLSLLGYSREEYAGLVAADWARLVHPDDRQRVLHAIREHQEGRTAAYISEHRILCKNGEWKWIISRGMVGERDEHGNASRMIGTYTDIGVRRTIEEALRVSQQQLRLFITNAPVRIAMFDRDMNYIACSALWAERHGVSPDALIGRNSYQAHPDVPGKWKENHRQALSGATMKSDGEEWLRSDGARIWVRWTITPWKDGQGDIGGIIIFSEEITDRVRAEEALRLSEAKLHAILNLAPVGIWLVGVDGRYHFVNKTFCEAMGVPESAFLATGDLTEILGPEAAGCLKSDRACLAQDEPHHSEETLTFVDGKPHLLEVTKVKLKDHLGETMGALGIAVDATERHMRETALRESEEKYRELFEYANDFAYSMDMDGNFTAVNNALLEVTGFSRTELVGAHISKVLTPENLAIAQKMAALKLSGGTQLTQYELAITARDGSQIPVDLISSLIYKDGKPAGTQGIARDITERRAREAALLAANVKAEAASRAKSEFLANMSHEIRTPMNSVIGMAHLALSRETRPGQRDYLEKILLSGEHLMGIIDDILDFSRIDAGKLRMESVELDIVRVVESLGNLVADKAKGKGLRYVVDIDPGIPRNLRGDPLRLRQVLLNFTDNAIKFTAQGVIAVSVRKVEDSAEGLLVHFEVCDTGIGMSDDELAGLFQSFQQADGSVTRKYGGTGLGLVISKRLVELMGGELGVTSEPGKGSTFWFRVHMEPGAANAPALDALFALPEDRRACRTGSSYPAG